MLETSQGGCREATAQEFKIVKQLSYVAMEA
jgi:hypothetical protein